MEENIRIIKNENDCSFRLQWGLQKRKLMNEREGWNSQLSNGH